MVNPLLCIAGILLTLSALAQLENNINVSPEIKEVTVYLNGAEVRHSASVSLQSGQNRIVFHGFSPRMQEKSVQVTTDRDVEIIAVSTSVTKGRSEDVSAEFRSLKDTIQSLNYRIDLLSNQIDAYQAEKRTLSENQYIGGTQSGVSIVELNKAADFFRERTLKINNALSALNRQHKNLAARIDSANAELASVSSKVDATRKQVVVVVSSLKDQKVEFITRYLVADAGWEATYDLIADDLTRPVLLKYKALVYNNTAIDWRNVKIKLSTADPSVSASKPFLTTWTLNYMSTANEGLVQNIAVRRSVSDSSSYEDIAVAELNTTFDIPKPYHIPSGGQPYLIDISSIPLNAAFEYLAIPKVDLSAFLIAKVTGWEKLSLIDGNANIYFGNTYIGESKIDTRLIADTLELSLGRDNQILVSRAKLEDVAGTKLIGMKRTESFVYEIYIKNNRKSTVNIKVLDQVPVSQESDISVDVEDISGASKDDLSGRLQWISAVPPGENVKYRVAFSVRYPKNRHVAIRKQRVVRTPRYRQ